jgi:hypothetical protein
MPFRPDILITESHRVSVVVQATVALPDLEATEEGLKQYMVGVACPIGLLITPTRMWLYRDFYTARSSESVQRVGEFDLTEVWLQPPPSQQDRFELFVQLWLEYLHAYPIQEMPVELREALDEYILPEVRTGEVGAAHPRFAA